jgi:hypothetical protein
LQLLLERSGWVVLAVVVALFVGWRFLRGRRVRHSHPRATRHLPGAHSLQRRLSRPGNAHAAPHQ